MVVETHFRTTMEVSAAPRWIAIGVLAIVLVSTPAAAVPTVLEVGETGPGRPPSAGPGLATPSGTGSAGALPDRPDGPGVSGCTVVAPVPGPVRRSAAWPTARGAVSTVNDLLAAPDPDRNGKVRELPPPVGTFEDPPDPTVCFPRVATASPPGGPGSPVAEDQGPGGPRPVGGHTRAPDPAAPRPVADPVVRDQTAGPAPTTGEAGGWMLPVLVALVLMASVPLVVLYRRLTRERLLDHDHRRRILEVLRGDPGVTAVEVADELDVHENTARHHLRLLLEFDEVERRRFGTTIRYYPNHGALSRLEKVLADAMKRPSRRALVETLAEDGALPSGELADRVGLAPSTASHHLGRLQEAGIVRRERTGKTVHYDLEPDARSGLRLLR